MNERKLSIVLILLGIILSVICVLIWYFSGHYFPKPMFWIAVLVLFYFIGPTFILSGISKLVDAFSSEREQN